MTANEWDQPAEQEFSKVVRLFAGEDIGDGMAPIPRGYVDEWWHRSLEANHDRYIEIVRGLGRSNLRHVKSAGKGVLPWLDRYHETYGHLHAVWFVDSCGNLDPEALAKYRAEKTAEHSWDCDVVT